jgi:protein-tyrosine phosphatase
MDVSEVAPGLWVGSAIYSPPDRRFDAVFDFSTFGYEDPYNCAVYVKVPFDDGPHVPKSLEPLAVAAKGLLDQGLSVLSVCDLGRNRSALFAVMVMRQTGSAQDAIERVREARAETLGQSGGALTNQTFVDFLLAQ